MTAATSAPPLAALSDQDLLTEAALAADLTRQAPSAKAQAEAFELLLELLTEVSRREELHVRLKIEVARRQALREAP
jgi:hypothetical protein